MHSRRPSPAEAGHEAIEGDGRQCSQDETGRARGTGPLQHRQASPHDRGARSPCTPTGAPTHLPFARRPLAAQLAWRPTIARATVCPPRGSACAGGRQAACKGGPTSERSAGGRGGPVHAAPSCRAGGTPGAGRSPDDCRGAGSQEDPGESPPHGATAIPRMSHSYRPANGAHTPR